MFAENLNTRLLAVLERPDLRVVADRQQIVFDATLDGAFQVDREGRVVLGAACLNEERVCAFHIRHALELSMLLDAATRLAADGAETATKELPILAGLCAARVAARFWLLDAAPTTDAPPDPVSWLAPMAASPMPDAGTLGVVWTRIRHLQASTDRPLRTGRTGQGDGIVPNDVVQALAACWNLLGPAETLMATGGDARLAVDPRTGLNHYGCSHRPRPWAVTFASSTASSLSERGFAGAEAARKRMTTAMLAGSLAEALVRETEQVRDGIGRHYGLAGSSGIVLTASGTDSEMAALAMCCLPNTPELSIRRPVSNVLLAPEETGAGVPLAAAGRHFASDTARGRTVDKGAWITGFPIDTRVLPVPIRDGAGRLLPPADVDAACIRMVEAEAASGRTVLLHRLDLSKTGLLAPSLDCLNVLQARLGEQLEVVVDACQARLDRRRVQDYIARGWMVMITGSKFFTGPPFCGALLLPARLADRLHGPGRLPEGLADYGGSADWPPGAAAVVADGGVNLGMVLRWQAAMAEMTAFAQVPEQLALERTITFIAGVEEALAASPYVAAVEVPVPPRPTLSPVGDACWDQLQTIRSFLVLAPGEDGVRRPLDVAGARLVYRWLNADVSRVLPDAAGEADRMLARLLCHIGQPAPVADHRLDGAMAGALRISVGARLLSGEPSHEGLAPPVRMAREVADVRRILDKIDLLLRHWPALATLDPEPRFASDMPLPPRADPGLNI